MRCYPLLGGAEGKPTGEATESIACFIAHATSVHLKQTTIWGICEITQHQRLLQDTQHLGCKSSEAWISAN